ncbi:MAG: hypothetical protein V4515_14560 [Chloroflexota bacterium]
MSLDEIQGHLQVAHDKAETFVRVVNDARTDDLAQAESVRAGLFDKVGDFLDLMDGAKSTHVGEAQEALAAARAAGLTADELSEIQGELGEVESDTSDVVAQAAGVKDKIAELAAEIALLEDNAEKVQQKAAGVVSSIATLGSL